MEDDNIEKEKNLINWFDELDKITGERYGKNFRYNGGWTKTVTSLDKTVATGYSIEGNFVTVGDFKEFYEDGLYLDCDIQGSRKHQDKNYRLIKLENGKMELINEILS